MPESIHRGKQTRTAAYRCPSCGAGVMTAVDVVSFAKSAPAAARIRLRCSNPGCPSGSLENVPAMDIERLAGSGDEIRLRFTVPCIFCGHTHSYTVASDMIGSRDSMLFSCPASGIDICFVGDTNHVKAALASSELELLNMMGDDGDSRGILGGGDGSLAMPEPEISEIIAATVRILEDEGRIYCKCPGRRQSDAREPAQASADGGGDTAGDDAERRIGIEAGPRYMRVFCRECGASKIIPALSHSAAQDFADSDCLVLE